jgi:hypothetical protein
MKRFIALVLFFTLTVTWGFAMDRAIGGGLLLNASSTSGSIGLQNNITADWNMSRAGFGLFGFYGVNQFLELNLGFLYKNPGDLTMTVLGYSETTNASDWGIEGTGALQLGIYGKYPIPFTHIFVLFPTVGIDLELTLSDDEGWWDDLCLRAGVGLDFFFSERLFLRSHLIYGAALPFGGTLDTRLTHGLLVKSGLGWMF